MSADNKTEEIEHYIYKRILENSKKEFENDYTESSADKTQYHSLDIAAVFRELEECNSTWNIQAPRILSSQKKITGPLFLLVKKILRKLMFWYIEPIIQQQRIFNASVNRSLHELCTLTDRSLNYHNAAINDLKNSAANLNQCIQELQSRGELEELKLVKLTRDLKALQGQIQSLEKVASLPPGSKESLARPVEADRDAEDSPSINYVEFENEFRGNEEDIKERLKDYLSCFQGKKSVLDIGCGRGEMVELFNENGIEAFGIDIDRDMVEHCQQKGLKVIQQDAADFLRTLGDNTLEGVFMGHVVEHLELDYLVQLFGLIHKKLKPGGVLALESPNPMCLYIYSASFYIDPTHVKPLNPFTLEYFLRSAGYKDLDISFRSPVPREQKLDYVGAEGEPYNTIDSNFEKLNSIIFGYQDYAVTAVK